MLCFILIEFIGQWCFHIINSLIIVDGLFDREMKIWRGSFPHLMCAYGEQIQLRFD